jgi:hypothetical protein
MKITAGCTTVAALFFGISSAWTVRLVSQGGGMLRLHETLPDEREHCHKITKAIKPVTSIAWDPATGPLMRAHGINFYESDNCLSGNGYTMVSMYGAKKMTTINLRNPMQIKSYVVLF